MTYVGVTSVGLGPAGPKSGHRAPTLTRLYDLQLLRNQALVGTTLAILVVVGAINLLMYARDGP